MKIHKLSPKQKEILRFILTDETALICDGAVRSGKTTIMAAAFLIWAMDFYDRTNFGICGKTVQSAERNVLKPLQQMEDLPYSMVYKISTRCLTVRCGGKENYFYLFGGKDESSYMLIQGITLAGVLFDEVALMPRSFVEQALSRAISFEHPKYFFNCNPESPNHYFYQEWIKEPRPNTRHIHFLLEDNPVLTPEMVARTKAMYSGVFYDRYINGRWVRAEGVIYELFAGDAKHYEAEKDRLPRFDRIQVGVDFGGNKSAFAFVATGLTEDFDVYALRSQRVPAKGVSVEAMMVRFTAFCEGIRRDYGEIDRVFADSAEQAIINSMRQQTPYAIADSVKGQIIDRIRALNILLATDRFRYVAGECDSLVSAMSDAVWDDKKFEDVRLDDGTSDIDTMDAFEYSWSAYIRQILRGG